MEQRGRDPRDGVPQHDRVRCRGLQLGESGGGAGVAFRVCVCVCVCVCVVCLCLCLFFVSGVFLSTTAVTWVFCLHRVVVPLRTVVPVCASRQCRHYSRHRHYSAHGESRMFQVNPQALWRVTALYRDHYRVICIQVKTKRHPQLCGQTGRG